MITIITDKINTFSQNSYNKFLDTINFHQLACSCGLSGSLIKHGYYKRSLKTSLGKISLSILRMKCKHCGKTHAIFLSFIVPYSQIQLNDHISIIKAHIKKTSFDPIMITTETIDEGNIRYILKNFKFYWKERLASFGFSISDPPDILCKNCLETFRRQFMQIKCTPNIQSC